MLKPAQKGIFSPISISGVKEENIYSPVSYYFRNCYFCFSSYQLHFPLQIYTSLTTDFYLDRYNSE